MTHVLTGVVGTNDRLIAEVARLYLKPGMKIADVTYGRGVFWKKTDLTPFTFLPTDLIPLNENIVKADLRQLPYENDSIDVVVFDPPYMHSSKYKTVKASIANCYKNNNFEGFGSHASVIEFYAKGMKEACRVLKPDGQLWVKCQDEIESSHQRWSHIELWGEALDLKLVPWDLFVLVSKTIPASRWPHQLHARKSHSYLWIFKKP